MSIKFLYGSYSDSRIVHVHKRRELKMHGMMNWCIAKRTSKLPECGVYCTVPRGIAYRRFFFPESFFKLLFSFVSASIKPRRLIKKYLIKKEYCRRRQRNKNKKFDNTAVSLCRLLWKRHSFTSACEPSLYFVWIFFGVLLAFDNKSSFRFERFILIK